jgi:hypothetical protein
MRKISLMLFFCLFLNKVYSQEVKIGIAMSAFAGFTSLKGLENEHKINWDLVCFGLEINNFLIDFTPSSAIFYYEKSNGLKTIGRKIYTGPNGGNYYINSNGKKVYVARGTQSSDRQVESFNHYHLTYYINSFGLAYKLSHNNLIYGPYIGYQIITPKINGVISINNKEYLNFYNITEDNLNNLVKNRVVFGGIIGFNLNSSYSAYCKLTNKNISLNLIFKLYE